MNFIFNTKILLAGLFASILSSVTHAGVLDFTEASSNGFQGSTTLFLSNATINSFGTDLFVYYPGDFGALGGGGFCGIDGGSCEAGAEVLFSAAISDLTLNTQGFNVGDSTTLSIFSDATLLDNITITSDAAVDFTGFNGITRLLIEDNSTGAGFSYNNFEFTASPVPLPAAAWLFGSGLLGLVGVARRKRA